MQVQVQVIEGAYMRDVLDQPAALTRTVAGLVERRELKAVGDLLRAQQFRRVVLTGMGASFHALQPLTIALASHGMTAMAVETSELIHHTPALLDGGSLIVVVSQSGRSGEIVRLVEQASGRATLIGITNDPASPLAQRAAHCLVTGAGDEATVSCKTYVSALIALAWLRGHLLGEELGPLREQLARAPGWVTRWFDEVGPLGRAIEAQASGLDGCEHVFLVARGPSLAAAGEGALIIKEASQVHAEAMSAAAFRHGPLEMAAAGMVVVIYEGGEPTAALNRKLAQELDATGARVILVGPSAPAGAFRVHEGVPVDVRPILEVLPAQLLSLALAATRGREAGLFQRATKVTTVE